MKAFSSSGFLQTALALGLGAATSAFSAPSPELPAISSPFAELRRAPVWQSEALPLAKTWGPALPLGTRFQVNKVYGRWVFGHALPPANMQAADYAPAGWVFSRQLVMPGDSDTLSPTQWKIGRAVVYHSREARTKLFGKDAFPSAIEFLETLTLSKKTLTAFSLPESLPATKPSRTESWMNFPLPVSSAFADEKGPATLGHSGPDLSFLDQEISVIQEKKRMAMRARESKKLKPPPAPTLDTAAKAGMLGRYMLERYLVLPPLSLEEVDGYVYMRATALRALQGCSAQVRDHWKNRRWNFFRVFRMKSRPEVAHPWFEVALPGGYFAVSGKAIEQAASEAELAFLVVRQLAREAHKETHLKKKTFVFGAKDWPGSLAPLSEEAWNEYLRDQSTLEAEGFDVADEIAVDMEAVECVSRAGYQPLAALAYLKKLAANKDQPWAAWYAKHQIGLDYRVERMTSLVNDALAKQKFPEGKESQQKRFQSASRQWNLLP